jgi:hypothetical protein
MDAKKEATLRRVEDATNATGRGEALHRQVLYVEEEVNRLASGYAQAVLAGAVTGKYAPENLFGNCSALLDLIGLDSGTEATRDYCSAVVQWHIDQLKGE